MNFISAHGPNVGSNNPLGPTPLQYNLKVLFALPAAAILVSFFKLSSALSWALALLSVVAWVRYFHVSPWAQFLFPLNYQSDFIAADGHWDVLLDLRTDTSKWLIIKNPKYDRFKKRRIPLFVFVEAFREDHISVAKDDLVAAMTNFREWGYAAMDWNYLKFLIVGYLGDIFVHLHSRNTDSEQVEGHYNTGNDFFGWFLGHRMVYTSGYYLTGDESLEKAQDQKMEVVARKIGLKEGHRVLDLGCGWGTWALYTAKKWGTKTVGLSIAKEQIQFARDRAEKNGIKNIEWLCKDYRDMPQGAPRFDRVTCFEMSEHVGVLRYPAFLKQVWDALEDDGVFYLQIAGLRERWQYEDVAWGLFMYRYIFRGADASLPLGWVVGQLERAGFEVHSIENVGFHYGQTIAQWRENWLANKAVVSKTYSSELHRIYDLFLSWSTLIAAHGSSHCWQIVAYKNLDAFKRKQTFSGVLNNAYKATINLDDLK